MPITVLEAATSYNLTTVDRVVAELGLTADEIGNNRTTLNQLIARASDAIRSMTDRVFAKEKVEETLFVRRSTPRIIVSRTPIVSLDSIALDDDVVTASSYFIEDAERGFIYREDAHWGSTVITGGAIRERATQWGKYDWKVTYTGGYDLPSFSENPNLPLDIERAAIELVASWFHSRRTDPNIASERIGDASVSYRDSGAGGIPPSVQFTVEKWRRID